VQKGGHACEGHLWHRLHCPRQVIAI